MTFGKYLMELRESRGLSQRHLARWADVTNSTISRLENDQVSPDLKTISKLAKALDVDQRVIIDKFIELNEERK